MGHLVATFLGEQLNPYNLEQVSSPARQYAAVVKCMAPTFVGSMGSSPRCGSKLSPLSSDGGFFVVDSMRWVT